MMQQEEVAAASSATPPPARVEGQAKRAASAIPTPPWPKAALLAKPEAPKPQNAALAAREPAAAMEATGVAADAPILMEEDGEVPRDRSLCCTPFKSTNQHPPLWRIAKSRQSHVTFLCLRSPNP